MRSTRILCLLASAALCAAQELSPEAQRFHDSFKNMLSTSDLRGIGNLVAKDTAGAEAVIDHLCERFCYTDNPERFSEAEVLGRALDEHQSGKRYQKRLEYLQGTDKDTRGRRFEALTKLVAAIQSFQTAREKKDAVEWRRAFSELVDVADAFDKVKDFEWVAYARYHLGICQDNLGEYFDCVKSFDKAMDEWIASGRPKDPMYNYMVDRRRDLIAKGYDPNAKASPEGAAAKRNAATSYKEGSDWASFTTEARVMRSPDAFLTPSPFGADHPFLWRQFNYADKEASDIGYVNACKPFGTGLKVLRDGAKATIDVDGDSKGDVPAKLIDGKATLVEVARPDAKDDRFALFALTIGQNQFNGLSINYTNRGAYRSATYREGKWLDQPFVLIDDNGSGAFGDPELRRDGVTRGYPSWMDNDALLVGKGKKARPFSEVVLQNGAFYRLKLTDPQAREIKFRELDVETGLVQLKWNGPAAPSALVIAEIGEFPGAYFDVSGKDPAVVPVGRYEVAYGKIELGSRSSLEQVWIFKGRSEAFTVKAGETFVLEMGEPYRLDFDTEDKGETFIVKGNSLLVYDRREALIGRMFSPKLVLPQVSVRVKEGGAVLVRNKPTKMLDSEAFNKSNDLAWFFADFVADKSPNMKCEAQLSLKKHHLLGGPLESDWK